MLLADALLDVDRGLIRGGIDEQENDVDEPGDAAVIDAAGTKKRDYAVGDGHGIGPGRDVSQGHASYPGMPLHRLEDARQ